VSRYELGLIFARVFGYPEKAIQPISQADVAALAYRPRDVSLDSTRAQRLLDMRFRTPDEGLIVLKEQGAEL
jgi:dTDP-4-dehydrorhamnose reductase